MLLNHFKSESREALENMSDSEIYSLSLAEKIERALIINGYTDHVLCSKIDMVDVMQLGADTIKFTVISTIKRKRKPSFFHKFALDETHGAMKLLEHGEL